jgi:3-oxoadipate enol-lactonase
MAEITTSDGCRIHYTIEGRADGPHLVLSNSLGTSLAMWDAQAKEAAGLGFRVIRYDQRGHGDSDAPKGDYTLGRLALDVIDLLDALGIERTAFCGLSMGGMTGMRLAKDHPARFSRMALCNTAAAMPPRAMWEARIGAVNEGGMQAIAESIAERWFTAGFRAREPAVVDRIRRQILATDSVGYLGCCAAIRDMDESAELGLIESPVLVAVGAHDPAMPPVAGDYLVRHIPGAQKVVLDAAHLSNVEEPDAFNRHVIGFLASGHR